MPTSRASLALPIVLLLAGLACFSRLVGPPEPSAEEATLGREVVELRRLVAAAEQGKLLDFAQMLVVVGQDLVQRLLSSVVPLEGDVGEASVVGHPASAALGVYGGLDVIGLDPQTGMLRARASVYAVDVPKAGLLGVHESARRLTRALAAGGLEALLAPIEVPVRIEDRLRLPPVETRRARIPGADVPVEAAVASLRVFGGKLSPSRRACSPSAETSSSPSGWAS